MKNKIIDGVNKYYTSKVEQFGNTPQGVDWNSKESQHIRFEQLTKIIRKKEDFSVFDFGCGYGELYNYLQQHYAKFNFIGYDISKAMISAAKSNFANNHGITFTSELPTDKYDYVVASGIFNVRMDLADENEWKNYILDTLNVLNKHSLKGFSFNALTTYSDKEYMKEYLYYSDPLFLFDYCKKNFSNNIALLHDYELYEFTILIRK